MSLREDRPIRSVAVLGDGVVGLSAALAFARSLPQVQVTVVRTAPDPAALADRLPGSWPNIARFHRLIGLSEADVVRSGAATFRLGARFDAWSADGASWFHVNGLHGLPIGAIKFHELWARARRAGRALPYFHYAAAAVLAQAGKFVHPQDDANSPLSTYDYDLRLDPQRYRDLLVKLALRRGIALPEPELQGVERRADGHVAAAVLDGGARLEADLFIACSGPASLLLTGVSADWEDWRGWLPCDRITIGVGPPVAPSSCDIVQARPDGWRTASALPGRELRLRVHASVAAAGSGDTSVEAGQTSVEEITLAPGRRRQPWRGNVLAIGDAAQALDPLHGANLAAAHSAIHRALELLPGRDFAEVELAEYNRRTEQEITLLRDFMALHYALHPRARALWRDAAQEPLPQALADLRDQFTRRGRLPLLEEDLVGREVWVAALIGLGLVPQATSPLADAVDEGRSEALLEDLAQGFATLPAQLPAYADYLAHALRDLRV